MDYQNQNSSDDLRISDMLEVKAPQALMSEISITTAAKKTVLAARKHTQRILSAEDDRLIVVCGPCSIHDPVSAREYAQRLLELRKQHAGQLHIIMRVYFEKPRTTIGWKGLINDPGLNGSFEINKGLQTARALLLDLNNMGMPCGTEYLDLISPQYYSDLIAWGAIGARTTESQSHRELASGLSCPVGFKNGTNGNLQIAVDAIGASSKPHHFLSVTKAGHSAIFGTTGNHDCHIILRGGTEPNYDAANVQDALALLRASNLPATLMIDMSHANSRKQHREQIPVGENIAAQIARGESGIAGVMIESHLIEGKQSLEAGKPLVYGQSITDACIDFEQTEGLIETLATAVEQRRRR